MVRVLTATIAPRQKRKRVNCFGAVFFFVVLNPKHGGYRAHEIHKKLSAQGHNWSLHQVTNACLSLAGLTRFTEGRNEFKVLKRNGVTRYQWNRSGRIRVKPDALLNSYANVEADGRASYNTRR